MAPLLLIGTVLGVLGLLGIAGLSAIGGAKVRAMVVALLALALAALYGVGVLAASLASREETLAPGETKYFCGFYLDCHVGVAVLADSVVPAIGARHANGAYHVLTLRFSSNAERETLSPWDLHLALLGDDGVRFDRDPEAEAVLGVSEPIERSIPAGGEYQVRVVFDVPGTNRALRLFAEQGPSLKFPEVFLIGDEASLLHRKTLLALPG
jgi:hypothetical protein